MKTQLKKGEPAQIALGIGGGITANQLTNFLEKQPWMADYAKYAPLATLAIGLAGAMFVKNQSLKSVCHGMIIVSGTEQAEGLLSGLLSGELGLGFTPSFLPEGQEATLVNGVAVR